MLFYYNFSNWIFFPRLIISGPVFYPLKMLSIMYDYHPYQAKFQGGLFNIYT